MSFSFNEKRLKYAVINEEVFMTTDHAVYAEKEMDLHCYPPVSFINMLILFFAKLIYIKVRKRRYFLP